LRGDVQLAREAPHASFSEPRVPAHGRMVA
jgi:hypothetical protein